MTPECAFVLLASGRKLDLLHPDPRSWTHEDLATGLSRTYCWGGHSCWDWPLSVAQHSLLVLALHERISDGQSTSAQRLRELLHDADKLAGLNPTASLKPHLGPAFATVTARLGAAVAERYRLPAWTPAEHALHKRADRLAAASEAHHTVGWRNLADMRDILDIGLEPLLIDPLLSRYGAELPAGTRAWEPWPARLAARLFLAELLELDGATQPATVVDLSAAEERRATLAQLGAAFSRLPPRTRLRCARPPTGNSLTDTFIYVETDDISQQHVEGVIVDGERDEDGQWLLDGEFTVFTTDEELILVQGWGCRIEIQ